MGYTEDSFICGICSSTLNSIEDYVFHMVKEEKCTTVFTQSKVINKLVLPRFLSVKSADVAIKKPSNIPIGEDVDIEKKALLWKCTSCSFVFSHYEQFKAHCSTEHSSTVVQSEVPFHPEGEVHKKPKFVKLEYIALKSGNGELEEIDVHDVPSTAMQETQDMLLREKMLTNEVIFEKKTPFSSFERFDADDNVVDVEEEEEEIEPILENPVLEKDTEDVFVYGDNNLSCEYCDQTFKTSRSLQQHVTVVHSSRRQFECSFSNCGSAFKTKGSLLRHIRRHTGERPYVCGRCGRRFRESGTLVKHSQSKVSCVEKSDRQLVRYGATLPLPPHDNKTNVRLLKKEELLGHGEIDNCEDEMYSPAGEQENCQSSSLNGRTIKQERDRDSKIHQHQLLLNTKMASYEPSGSAGESSATAGLIGQSNSLSIKQEVGSRLTASAPNRLTASEPNRLTSSAPNRLTSSAPNFICKRELLHASQANEETEEMLGTMEDEYDNESLNNSFQAHSPSSDSIISFNPSLIGVPDSCFPSLMEDIMSPTRWDNLSPIDDFLEDHRDKDIKPRLGIDVKPRMNACVDVKPKLLSEPTQVRAGPEFLSENVLEVNNFTPINNSNIKTQLQDIPQEQNEEQDIDKNKKTFTKKPNFTCIFSCPFCDRTFNVRSGLLNHLYSHKNQIGPHCSECSKSFSTREGVMRHLARHLSRRRFVCAVCQHQFNHASQLSQHMLCHSENKTVLCQVCGRAFKSVSARNLHAKGHSGVREACDVCGRTFSTKASLERHSRTHSGERPYGCPHCNATFRDQGTLARHVKNKKPCCLMAKNEDNREAGGGTVHKNPPACNRMGTSNGIVTTS